MKKTFAALLTTAALVLGQAPAHAAIDWKPGRTRETVSVNVKAGWRAAATYTWRSGRAPNGAYVIDPVSRVYRVNWLRDSEPDCAPGIGDLNAVKFKTVFQTANGRVVLQPGIRRLVCPQDGSAILKIRDRGWKGQLLSYTRGGDAPVAWTYTHWNWAVAPDREIGLRGFKMTYRGRQMPLPW